jgi:hypothetical protein
MKACLMLQDLPLALQAPHLLRLHCLLLVAPGNQHSSQRASSEHSEVMTWCFQGQCGGGWTGMRQQQGTGDLEELCLAWMAAPWAYKWSGWCLVLGSEGRCVGCAVGWLRCGSAALHRRATA